MRHPRWAAECPSAEPWRFLFSREKAKEDGGPSPVRLTGGFKGTARRGAGAGVGKGSTACSASAMVLLFASIPEGLERRSRMLDFTHSRGRSRTVPTTRECMAFKRSWIGRTAARLADHNDSRATCGDCARSSRPRRRDRVELRNGVAVACNSAMRSASRPAARRDRPSHAGHQCLRRRRPRPGRVPQRTVAGETADHGRHGIRTPAASPPGQ